MRILLVADGPLDLDAAGAALAAWQRELQAAGHAARLICCAESRPTTDHAERRVVVCDSRDATADWRGALPYYQASRPGLQNFSALSERQWSEYRALLRDVLDEEIRAFDPQAAHASHVGLGAHLALESGVPYVACCWGDELRAAREPRWRPIVEQAAENAGRILAMGNAARDELLRIAPDVDAGRVQQIDEPHGAGTLERLLAAYGAVWATRTDGDQRG